MAKKILITIGVAVAFGVAYYLISPIFRVVEKDEQSPLKREDAMAGMSLEDRMRFDSEMEKMKDVVLVKADAEPKAPAILSQAELVPRAHDVEGRAIFISTESGNVLRFEDLNTINGPDLRIWLATDLSAENYVDLGAIRATKGNVNYSIPAGVDLERYNKVLIWCRAFRVLFSYADMGNEGS